MGIIITQLDEKSIKDLNKCDNEFVIDSKIIPHYEKGRLSYTVVSVPAHKKRYATGPDTPDYSVYVNNPYKTAYLAYIDGKLAGQIILRDNWNKFALIEDIRVDVKFRLQGIGRELLNRAETWAKYRGFPGIMVETQDTNVGACRFYEKVGFVLGGLDTFLYKAAYAYADEIALFWYLVFQRTNIAKEPSLTEVLSWIQLP